MLNAVLPLQYWVIYVFYVILMEEIGSAMGVLKGYALNTVTLYALRFIDFTLTLYALRNYHTHCGSCEISSGGISILGKRAVV